MHLSASRRKAITAIQIDLVSAHPLIGFRLSGRLDRNLAVTSAPAVRFAGRAESGVSANSRQRLCIRLHRVSYLKLSAEQLSQPPHDIKHSAKRHEPLNHPLLIIQRREDQAQVDNLNVAGQWARLDLLNFLAYRGVPCFRSLCGYAPSRRTLTPQSPGLLWLPPMEACNLLTKPRFFPLLTRAANPKFDARFKSFSRKCPAVPLYRSQQLRGARGRRRLARKRKVLLSKLCHNRSLYSQIRKLSAQI